MTDLQNKLVVLAAGGTGGHVFPAEALATELKSRGCKLVLITDNRGGNIGGTLGELEVHRIRAGGVAGKSLFGRLKAVPELAIGTLQARRLLTKLKPDAVIGFGGYASLPTMAAAGFIGLKSAIHEQNAVLGRANRLLAGKVQHIATSFDNVQFVPEEAKDKVVKTGMPVRETIIAKRDVPYSPIVDGGKINVLVLGGSQGARVLSEVIPAALKLLPGELRDRVQMVQQCRPEDIDGVRALYQQHGVEAELKSFFDDVPERLAACHLLISRSGASSVSEATCVGRPAILVPYKFAIDDHQSRNAHALDDTGAGWLIPQDNFNSQTLAQRLEQLFTLPETLTKAAACAHKAGRPDAAKRLADMVEGMIKNGNTNNNREAA